MFIIELRKVDVYSSSTSTRLIYTKYMYIQRCKVCNKIRVFKVKF